MYASHVNVDVPFFEQAQSTNVRGLRNCDSRKAKRKRYREKKNLNSRFKISTPAQKSLFEKHLCSRWKERKERYEMEQQLDEQHDEETVAQHLCDQQNNDNVSREQIVEHQQKIERVEKEYNELFVKLSTSNSALLPAVLIPIEDKKPLSCAASVISRMEQQSIIRSATKDRDQALMEAKHYRNLAETLKKEKRDIEHKYAKKVEVVRDFWRNKIVEGDSRGGKILRASLLKK